MSIDDRVWPIRGIQDSINEDAELTDSQKQELDCRIADMEAHPDDEVPWEDVYNESLKRVRH
jgi:putative addiction module component (TIGR02574 family)